MMVMRNQVLNIGNENMETENNGNKDEELQADFIGFEDD